MKRALRAIQSPAYEKARKKNPLLPEVTDRASLENTFKLLPLSMLALRVVQIDNRGPDGKKPKKRVKGQWNVKIEQQQEAQEDMYYIWLWEGSQIKRQLYAALALVLIFAVVLYPLWPLVLRQGVYYLSWGMLGLLGLFFLMAIFRVILFCITYFAVPPGLWLYPNLWEDVSFMDSFRPVWAWHEVRFREEPNYLDLFANNPIYRLSSRRRRRRGPLLLLPTPLLPPQVAKWARPAQPPPAPTLKSTLDRLSNVMSRRRWRRRRNSELKSCGLLV